ncbi:hypothetical protein [Thiolinea disciformis]|uniref:hypothetical protein n=1 Tax=Thiolinea disciformis TaxID=125614 RepID=UPI0003825B28|nr:hypothetical protein [Thiolinea disciformis]
MNKLQEINLKFTSINGLIEVGKPLEVHSAVKGMPFIVHRLSRNKLDKAVLSIVSNKKDFLEVSPTSEKNEIDTSIIRIFFTNSVVDQSSENPVIARIFSKLENKLEDNKIPVEVAIAGIYFESPIKNNSISIRIKIASQGVWLPLVPIDTFQADENGRIDIDFPVVAASELLIELLEAKDKVLLPTKIHLNYQDSLKIKITQQACHVSMAIGDDLPFWSHQGVLPHNPVNIHGLKQALNRYIDDHPETEIIPLLLKAANRTTIEFSEQEFINHTPMPIKKIEAVVAQRNELSLGAKMAKNNEEYGNGQLCNNYYSAAQAFTLKEEIALSAIHIYLKSLNQVALTILVSLHADEQGLPALAPLHTIKQPNLNLLQQGAWLRFEWLKPIKLTATRWWIVLQTEAYDVIWYYRTDIYNEALNEALYRIKPNGWLPLYANKLADMNKKNSNFQQQLLVDIRYLSDTNNH